MKMFRILALALFSSCLSLTAVSQTAPAPSGDDAAIRALIQKEIDGWDKHDPAMVASCFTPEINWQNPFGVRIHSSAMLQKFLTSLFKRPTYLASKDTTAPHITDVHILSPTTAVVWSEEKSDGQLDEATGKPMKPRYSHYIEVLVKKDGAWLITDSMIMDEYPQP